MAIDPDNSLLGRMSVRRLEAEAIRDAMMVVTGTHSQAMYGPPAPVNPDEVARSSLARRPATETVCSSQLLTMIRTSIAAASTFRFGGPSRWG